MENSPFQTMPLILGHIPEGFLGYFVAKNDIPSHFNATKIVDACNFYEQAASEHKSVKIMVHAVKECLKAEKNRRQKLLPGAPATDYCEKRIAMLEDALKLATTGSN